MAIIVEDGSIVAGANSYVSGATLTTFATARGVTLVSGTETLLVQAMDYIEQLAYKGIKRTRDQSLQWPRVDVYIDGYYFEADEIPQQLKDALCHQAIAIDQGTDALQDVVKQVVSERVGDLEVTYSSGTVNGTTNVKVLHTLRKLLDGGDGGSIRVSKA